MISLASTVHNLRYWPDDKKKQKYYQRWTFTDESSSIPHISASFTDMWYMISLCIVTGFEALKFLILVYNSMSDSKRGYKRCNCKTIQLIKIVNSFNIFLDVIQEMIVWYGEPLVVVKTFFYHFSISQTKAILTSRLGTDLYCNISVVIKSVLLGEIITSGLKATL